MLSLTMRESLLLAQIWLRDCPRKMRGETISSRRWMFGLPAAALAIYHTAKDTKRKIAQGLLLSAAIVSFFNGVTEPLEFSFMFLAPGAVPCPCNIDRYFNGCRGVAAI